MKNVHTPIFNEIVDDNTTVFVPVHNDPEFDELVKKAAELSNELQKTINQIAVYKFDLTVELKKKTAL